MPLTSPGNDDDTGENHQPTLRKNTAEPVEQTLKQNTDVEYAIRKDLLEVRYTVENRNKGQTPVRNDLILAFQNGIGLRTVSPTTWTVMLEGAHARMTQSFRLRDRDARPVIQPDRTW